MTSDALPDAMTRPRALSWLRAAALALLAAAGPARAQAIEVRAVAMEDGRVAVLHSAPVGLADGVRVERDAGAGFVPVTEAPVRLPRSEAAAAAAFGDDLAAVLDATEQTQAFPALVQLAADPVAAAVQSAVAPGVAHALARLVYDDSAPAGQRVTYRVTLVGTGDAPTGPSGETTLTVTPSLPAPPAALSASHDGLRVRLAWLPPRDDAAVGYHVFADGRRVTDRLVLRNAALDADSVWVAFAVPAPGLLRLTVRSVDLAGQTGPPSAVLPYSVTDNVPPRFVEGVAAFVGADGAVDVTWPLSPETDLAGYRVYRATGTAEDTPDRLLTQTLVPATTTVYRDVVQTGVGARAWFYRVSAVDTAGNESPLSSAALAQVEDHTPPPAPAGLTARYADGAASLAWTADVSADVQTFVLERRRLALGAAPTRARVNADPLRATAFVDFGEADLGLREGEVYRYYVAAQDSARNVSLADSVDLRIPNLTPPAPPGAVQALSDRGHRVRLTWTASESLDVVGYRVTRAGGAPVDVTGTAYRDDDVTPGTAYTYAVVALDAGGNESAPSHGEVLFRDATRPPAVRNVRARISDRGVAVTWEPSPAPDVTSYRVERATIPTGVYTPLDAVGVTAWTHGGARTGWYRVVAVDSSGLEAMPSEPVRAVAL